MEKEMKFCQSCGMPLTDDILGTNADGSKNEDYCIYCYKDGKFLQDCTMDEMIEHCAQFVGAVNEGLPNPITKEEYIGQMKMYFPQLKRWRKALTVNDDEVMKVNPALAGVKELIAQMADSLPIAFISSVDNEGYPCTKAMLAPRKREGIKVFYARQSRVLNTSIRESHLLAPTFQMWEVHLHLADVFFLRDGLRQPFVDLIHKLGAMLNHLLHRAVLQELTVLIAIHAILFVFASVGVGAEYLVVQRHAAALTKSHFVFHYVFQ